MTPNPDPNAKFLRSVLLTLMGLTAATGILATITIVQAINADAVTWYVSAKR